jgi:hypothetical protein
MNQRFVLRTPNWQRHGQIQGQDPNPEPDLPIVTRTCNRRFRSVCAMVLTPAQIRSSQLEKRREIGARNPVADGVGAVNQYAKNSRKNNGPLRRHP